MERGVADSHLHSGRRRSGRSRLTGGGSLSAPGIARMRPCPCLTRGRRIHTLTLEGRQYGRPSPPDGSGLMTEVSDVTQLLRSYSAGRTGALDQLIPILYDELRRIAHGLLRDERSGHTLNTTALVHEAYLKLVNVHAVEWHDRAHFLSVVARVMRRVLVDYARARRREKRGGGAISLPLNDVASIPLPPFDDLLDLEDALCRLEALGERQCRVVECRCFAGLTVDETAVALNTSPATVKRDWEFSRAWLNRALDGARSEVP
jgi:RNA polymerase sigma factor (TIGR02999 family)